jgi:hypothetical protein
MNTWSMHANDISQWRPGKGFHFFCRLDGKKYRSPRRGGLPIFEKDMQQEIKISLRFNWPII